MTLQTLIKLAWGLRVSVYICAHTRVLVFSLLLALGYVHFCDTALGMVVNLNITISP